MYDTFVNLTAAGALGRATELAGEHVVKYDDDPTYIKKTVIDEKKVPASGYSKQREHPQRDRLRNRLK